MGEVSLVDYLNGNLNAVLLLEYIEIRMREQGRKSTRFDKTLMVIRCSYRGDHGCRDMLGMVLPEHLYLSAMDQGHHTSIHYILEKYGTHLGVREDIPAEVYKTRLHFLEDIQIAHDSMRMDKRHFRHDLQDKMHALRLKWGLHNEETDFC